MSAKLQADSPVAGLFPFSAGGRTEMMHAEILAREAGVYTELPDGLGISFTTSELFHGSLADCLRMLGACAPPARGDAYIETVDGAIRLEPADIAAVLAEAADRAA